MNFSPESLLANLIDLDKVDRYLVAFSGGLDSHVLLHALSALRIQNDNFPSVEALHVHHGVSDNADRWVKQCETVCQHLSVPITVRQVNPDLSVASRENAFREARYAAFQSVIETGDVLLLAHHADDQFETILFRMMRGTGAQGAAGIRSTRPLGRGQLLRPLLSFSREDLETYARLNKLSWIEDESNADTGFDRNFLRHKVVPLLTRRWPGCRQAMTRFAKINTQIQQSVDFFVQRELSELGEGGERLNLDWLASYETPVQLELLRGWLQRLDLPAPGYDQLLQIQTRVMAARPDAQPVLSWSGVEIRRFNGALYAMLPLPKHTVEKEYIWSVSERLHLPSGGVLSAEKTTDGSRLKASFADTGLVVRFRQGGERCQPAGRIGSHPLKKLLHEYRVPPWLRDRVPLIFDQETLIAVANLWICEGFQADESEPGYSLCWYRF